MPNLNSVPDGPVQDLMLGLDQCALVDGGALECFGGQGFEQWVKDGTYAEIPDNSEFLYCGIRNDGAMSCEDSTLGAFAGPQGEFDDIDCLVEQCCVLDAVGGITCGIHHAKQELGGLTDVWLDIDPGPWRAISASKTRFCAVAIDGTLSCWDASLYSQNDLDPVPEGNFVDVDLGDYHACALGADGQVTCWGRDNNGETSPPE
ncbi:RCC1 domain-containing protein [Myxococcota bacterium]|nr:RCC1 domain-containing protein [Myxococcota bacterium]